MLTWNIRANNENKCWMFKGKPGITMRKAIASPTTYHNVAWYRGWKHKIQGKPVQQSQKNKED